MDEFFNRDPKIVAKDLIDKVIKIGRNQGVILGATPQTREDNDRWLASKPLFGEKPVDFYVSRYRAGLLPFLRTATDTCVRIDHIRVGGVGGQDFKKPTHVCLALGIDKEITGDVVFDGSKIITVKVHSKRKRKHRSRLAL